MIEKKVEEFYTRNVNSFTVEDILNEIGCTTKREETGEQIMRMLECDQRFFGDSLKQNFSSKQRFFHHAEFVLTPDDFELQEGILFPGHRFMTFCEPDIFPSEIVLRECGGPKIKTVKKTIAISALTPYHLLMGTEQISDFLVAEDESHDIWGDTTADSQVCLNVFDMRKIYADNNFKPGDILVVRVLDWGKGEFDFTCRSGSSRSTAKIRKWIELYSDALEKVIDNYDRYLELPEYLAWGFFYGGKDLLGENGASLDEFYRSAERIEIRFEQGQSFFAKTFETEEENDGNTQEEGEEILRISGGTTASLEDIMRETGTPMTMHELDAFMLDNCYNREFEFDDFYARCFGERRLRFADEAQEVVFMNYLEDRWESIAGKYNRHFDEPKAPVRESILEITEERLDWFHVLADMEIPESQLPRVTIKKLAGLTKRLDGILGMLNSEKYELEDNEAESMMDTIERSAVLQDEILEQLNSWMNRSV